MNAMLRLLAERVGSRARLAFGPRVRGSSPPLAVQPWSTPPVVPVPGTPPAPPCSSRGFAAKVKGNRSKSARPNRASKPQGAPRSADAPPLRDAMRALVRKVHPDLFASGPAGASEVNDDSLKTIQGVLDAVTKSKSIPDAGIKRLRFYVRDESAPEGTRVVPFTFKTTGGDCRNLVARQLTQLFDAVGVPSAFKWEPGDWEHSPKSAENASNRGDVAEGWNLYPVARGHETDKRTTSAAASSSSSTSSSSSSSSRTNGARRGGALMGALKINDKLFEAIAAVPWIPEPQGDDRVRAINAEIVPRLAKEGWDVSRENIERIWRGERYDAAVMEGLDAASGLALGAIIRHARNFDRVYGTPAKPRVRFYP